MSESKTICGSVGCVTWCINYKYNLPTYVVEDPKLIETEYPITSIQARMPFFYLLDREGNLFQWKFQVENEEPNKIDNIPPINAMSYDKINNKMYLVAEDGSLWVDGHKDRKIIDDYQKLEFYDVLNVFYVDQCIFLICKNGKLLCKARSFNRQILDPYKFVEICPLSNVISISCNRYLSLIHFTLADGRIFYIGEKEQFVLLPDTGNTAVNYSDYLDHSFFINDGKFILHQSTRRPTGLLTKIEEKDFSDVKIIQHVWLQKHCTVIWGENNDLGFVYWANGEIRYTDLGLSDILPSPINRVKSAKK